MRACELKAARARLGLRQQKLAGALDVYRETVARWETGALAVPRWSPWPSRRSKPGRPSPENPPDGRRNQPVAMMTGVIDGGLRTPGPP